MKFNGVDVMDFFRVEEGNQETFNAIDMLLWDYWKTLEAADSIEEIHDGMNYALAQSGVLCSHPSCLLAGQEAIKAAARQRCLHEMPGCFKSVIDAKSWLRQGASVDTIARMRSQLYRVSWEEANETPEGEPCTFSVHTDWISRDAAETIAASLKGAKSAVSVNRKKD